MNPTNGEIEAAKLLVERLGLGQTGALQVGEVAGAFVAVREHAIQGVTSWLRRKALRLRRMAEDEAALPDQPIGATETGKPVYGALSGPARSPTRLRGLRTAAINLEKAADQIDRGVSPDGKAP